MGVLGGYSALDEGALDGNMWDMARGLGVCLGVDRETGLCWLGA